MRNLIFLFVVALVSIPVFSKQVSVDEARHVALRFMAHNSTTRSTSNTWQLAWTGEEPGTRSTTDAPFFVFTSPSGGFIVVAGDDLVTPILGYSETGTFKTEGMPEHIRYWFNQYKREIEWVRGQSSYMDEKSAADWQALSNDTYRPVVIRATDQKYIPTADWDQIPPYNDLCPEYKGARSLTGCVATAMAIVMKASNYPLTVPPAKIEYITSTLKIPVSRTLSTSYDFSDETLPMRYTDQSTAGQKEAVANLMADCGAIAEMNYSPTSSSATDRIAVKGMIDRFKFDKGVEFHRRNWYTPAEWDNRIKANLDANMPVLYYGLGDFAHMFVLDGYKPNYEYHFNWGWKGAANGYFKLTALNPNGINLTNVQYAYFNLKPDAGGPYHFSGYMIQAAETEIMGMEASINPIVKGESFTVEIGSFLNYGFVNLTGQLRLLHVNKEDELIEKISSPLNMDLKPRFYRNKIVFPATINTDIAEGDKIILAFFSNAETWNKIIGKGEGIIDTIKLETRVGIDQVATAKTMVFAVNGGIRITGESLTGKSITLFNIGGAQQAYRKAARSDETIQTAPGTYIVKVGEVSHKVIVK